MIVSQTYNTTVFSTVEYSCTEGYWFNGSLNTETAICNENGMWGPVSDCTGGSQIGNYNIRIRVKGVTDLKAWPLQSEGEDQCLESGAILVACCCSI